MSLLDLNFCVRCRTKHYNEAENNLHCFLRPCAYQSRLFCLLIVPTNHQKSLVTFSSNLRFLPTIKATKCGKCFSFYEHCRWIHVHFSCIFDTANRKFIIDWSTGDTQPSSEYNVLAATARGPNDRRVGALRALSEPLITHSLNQSLEETTRW